MRTYIFFTLAFIFTWLVCFFAVGSGLRDEWGTFTSVRYGWKQALIATAISVSGWGLALMFFN